MRRKYIVLFIIAIIGLIIFFFPKTIRVDESPGCKITDCECLGFKTDYVVEGERISTCYGIPYGCSAICIDGERITSEGNKDKVRIERTKATFILSPNETAEVIYSMRFSTGIEKKETFLLSVIKIDTNKKEVSLMVNNGSPVVVHHFDHIGTKYTKGGAFTLKPGESFALFVTEEGGMHCKLLDVNSEGALFETWFEIGPPHPIGPLPPSKIIIHKGFV